VSLAQLARTLHYICRRKKFESQSSTYLSSMKEFLVIRLSNKKKITNKQAWNKNEIRKTKKSGVYREKSNLVSNLCDLVLASNISLLHVMQGVRIRVLSEHWKAMWKLSFHLRFDQSQNLSIYIKTAKPNMCFAMVQCIIW
jgi:hypothetical protein